MTTTMSNMDDLIGAMNCNVRVSQEDYELKMALQVSSRTSSHPTYH